jgi:NAD(P)-dependent dehydrogenase (short-subunit alcohol dehydrogenase family)
LHDLERPAGFAADGDAGSKPEETLVSTVMDRFGAVDILINNAGMVWGGVAIDLTPENWNKVMAPNVDACFRVAQVVARKSMIPRKSGKIINISSIAGLGGPRPDGDIFAVAYNTSKGALITLTQALATEWGKYNINVNALCPGYFPTKLSAGLAKAAAGIAKVTPIGRRAWLKPESRCLVPANGFAEYAPEPNPETKKEDVVWFALNDDRPLFAFGGSGPNSGATEARSQNRSPALTSSTVCKYAVPGLGSVVHRNAHSRRLLRRSEG